VYIPVGYITLASGARDRFRHRVGWLPQRPLHGSPPRSKAPTRASAKRSEQVTGRAEPWATVISVTVEQTLLFLVVVPAAIYGLICLIVLWPKFTRVRYRAGQSWDFAPVFWVADPASIESNVSKLGHHGDSDSESSPQLDTARGGASGNW
jgi:hypothetical protein